MSNVKITELTEATDAAIDDVLVIVDDTVGTPVTKKITERSLYNARKIMSIVPAGNFTLTAGTSAQPAFPTTGDVFTLEGATTYEFEGSYFITKSGTTCTTALLFALAGGASVTSIRYVADAQSIAVNTTGATIDSLWVDRATATVVNATSINPVKITFKGLIRMNAGGTVTPQIQFSAIPTTPVMLANSYIKFTKIGTNVENTIGSVS